MTESKIEDSVLGLPLTSRPNSSQKEPKVKRSRSGRLLFFVGSFAAVIILGFLGYGMISRSNASNDPQRIQGKVAMSEQELRDVVNAKHLIVYWAGPVSGAKYSLTQKPGQSFVRYLPAGRGLTDTGNTFRIIATYSEQGAFALNRTAGRLFGNVGFTNIDGQAVFYEKARPTNVYMAIKDKDIQLEIFDPGVDQALGLSLIHGQIQQIS